MTPKTRERLALVALLHSAFEAIHPVMDHWAQRGEDARLKGLHGRQLVHADGTPATGEERRPTMTASACGRRAAARHVARYTLGQVAGTVAVTRALGYRVPPGALLAGAAINAATHFVIDRREPLLRLATAAGKGGYIAHCGVVRQDPESGEYRADQFGPGTAAFELDQSAHRFIGWIVAAGIALVAVPR
ncbi:hypothetical protein ACGFX7_06165 [Streptomyces harbinensis]|uniref:hypothetical protein n=1 Tax=Streptomyces harbinensis TaxID=1176198 RepID=UPI003714FAD0